MQILVSFDLWIWPNATSEIRGFKISNNKLRRCQKLEIGNEKDTIMSKYTELFVHQQTERQTCKEMRKKNKLTKWNKKKQKKEQNLISFKKYETKQE